VKDKRVLPPTYLLIAILLMLALHFLVPVVRFIPMPWNILGLVPLACGIALNLVADRAFQRAQTTVKPYEESAALVTTGVFTFTRNPMYLGYVLILLGVALVLRSLLPFAVIVVFALLIDRVFIRIEEQMLAERFGQQWLAYAQKVRRWV
jgi:protein-S-isoprenylcysteine O-methyltransferase Ste14